MLQATQALFRGLQFFPFRIKAHGLRSFETHLVVNAAIFFRDFQHFLDLNTGLVCRDPVLSSLWQVLQVDLFGRHFASGGVVRVVNLDAVMVMLAAAMLDCVVVVLQRVMVVFDGILFGRVFRMVSVFAFSAPVVSRFSVIIRGVQGGKV